MVFNLKACPHFQVLNLKSLVGECDTTTIPLRNAGNIPLEVYFEVTHWPDFFSATPNQLSIPPGGYRNVNINFLPKQSTSAKFDR